MTGKTSDHYASARGSLNNSRSCRDRLRAWTEEACNQAPLSSGLERTASREGPGALRGASEKDAATEDEAALRTPGVTVMGVPSDLLPAVRELIAKHRR